MFVSVIHSAATLGPMDSCNCLHTTTLTMINANAIENVYLVGRGG